MQKQNAAEAGFHRDLRRDMNVELGKLKEEMQAELYKRADELQRQ